MARILAFVITALVGYLLGNANGALIASRLIYREDIRKKGSGNAGLTNFVRVYGKRAAPLVLAVDVVKTVLASLFAGWILYMAAAMPLVGKYWGALFAMVGHCYPMVHDFRGGKGALCGGSFLILLDWRVAAVGFGIFLVLTVLTRYVSLGSVAAAASLPFTTWWCYGGEKQFLFLLAMAVFMAGSIIWCHKSNLRRLIHGEENRLSFRKEANAS